MTTLNENLTTDVRVASIGDIDDGILDQVRGAPTAVRGLHNGAQWVI